MPSACNCATLPKPSPAVLALVPSPAGLAHTAARRGVALPVETHFVAFLRLGGGRLTEQDQSGDQEQALHRPAGRTRRGHTAARPATDAQTGPLHLTVHPRNNSQAAFRLCVAYSLLDIWQPTRKKNLSTHRTSYGMFAFNSQRNRADIFTPVRRDLAVINCAAELQVPGDFGKLSRFPFSGPDLSAGLVFSQPRSRSL